MNSTEKIVVANTNEDWWSLNECFFFQSLMRHTRR